MANFFPRWSNTLPLKLLLCLIVIIIALTAGVWYYFTPKYTRVGYMPIQPVAFSHEIHVNQLGMDCRYCHSFVEVSPHSNIPSTQSCMNCHEQVQRENPRLALVRESFETGKPIEWVHIHKPPDFVFFNHAVHVNRGVSCYSCHGNVNRMDVVYHAEPHSMAWCLDCHRAPENHLRPLEQVFNLEWTAAQDGMNQRELGMRLKQQRNIVAPQNCAGCHR